MASLIQIIQYLRPDTSFRGFADIYESIQSADGSPLPTMEEIEAARAAYEAERAAAASLPTREKKRSGLRAAWNTLPDWIRGPYRPLFDSANQLLDEQDDDAALAMISYAQPHPNFTDEQMSTFTAVKAQFTAGIADL